MKDISRRDFMKLGGMMAVGSMLSPLSGMGRALAQAPVVGSEDVTKGGKVGSRAKVYFTKHIDAPHLLKLYGRINEHILRQGRH